MRFANRQWVVGQSFMSKERRRGMANENLVAAAIAGLVRSTLLSSRWMQLVAKPGKFGAH